MKNILIKLLLGVLIVSCGENLKDGEETSTNKDQDSSEVNPDGGVDQKIEKPMFEPVNQEILKFSGTGDTIIEKSFVLRRGIFLLGGKHTGKGNFIVSLLDLNGKFVGLFINVIGNYEGDPTSIEIKSGGVFFLEIIADGDWSLESLVPKLREKGMPAAAQGSGNYTTDYFYIPEEMSFIISGEHAGESNYIVKFVSASSGRMEDLVFNEIGSYVGSEIVNLDPGYYIIEINAEMYGAWELDINRI